MERVAIRARPMHWGVGVRSAFGGQAGKTAIQLDRASQSSGAFAFLENAMSYIVIAPFMQPGKEYATQAEAEAKAQETVANAPKTQVYVAELLKKYVAEVKVSEGKIEPPAPEVTDKA